MLLHDVCLKQGISWAQASLQVAATHIDCATCLPPPQESWNPQDHVHVDNVMRHNGANVPTKVRANTPRHAAPHTFRLFSPPCALGHTPDR